MEAGVHRETQAGIAGGSDVGAELIVLSGGYADDEDYGGIIIYTGSGGQDRSGRQVADQTFTGKNKALVTSALRGLSVRVVRGSEHQSPYSPPSGYRYDGLFRVERYWRGRGSDGFLVCRYRLVEEPHRRPLFHRKSLQVGLQSGSRQMFNASCVIRLSVEK